MKNNFSLGIMQPYFFPYLGHFSLIDAVDEWIVFDISQYTPKTWMNRNRILHPSGGWQYVTVPLSNSSISIKSHEAKILNLKKTKKNIMGKLSHYKKKAPYFNVVEELINKVFSSDTDNSLMHLNVRSLDAVCQYLNIPFNYRICSELNLPLPKKIGAGEWALEICKLLGATSYFNPVSGQDIFHPKSFRQQNIDLYFVHPAEFKYKTKPYHYEPNLSILDVLMWNPVEVIVEAINNRVVKKGS